MNRGVKLSEAVGKLLSVENKDKSLGEIGDELSGFLIEIKEMVDAGKITYNGLTQEISKYMDSSEVPKPGSVSQLLLGCIEGEDWCPLREKENDVSFFYDPDTQRFVPVSGSESTKGNCAVIYLSGDPRDIDVDSLKELEDKGFQKMKIRYRGIADSIYKEIDITNLQKYISRLSRHTIIEESEGNKFNTFMSIVFLVVILIILYYMKNHRVPTK